MNKLLGIVLGAFLALGSPLQALKIQELKSPKGISFWFVQDASVPVISMAFCFQGGNAAVPEGLEGLGTFTMSMLDEGCGDLSAQQYKELVEDLGVTIGFSVDADHTCGIFRTTTQNQQKSTELLRTVLTDPSFSRDAIERVREQLTVDVKNYEKSPSFFNEIQMRRILFGKHPYGRRLDGTLASIEKISRKDMVGYCSAVFARQHLKVVVCGNLEVDGAIAMVDKVFGDLPAKSGYAPVASLKIATKDELALTTKPFPQSVCIFLQPGLKPTDPNYVKLALLSNILGDGFNSRLMQVLREQKGLVYGVGTLTMTWEGAVVFGGSFSSNNDEVLQAIDASKQIWKHAQEKGVTEQELQTAKDTMLGAFAFAFTSTQSTAQTLLGYLKWGFTPQYIYDRTKRIRQVTAAQLTVFAKEFLQPHHLTYIVTGDPKKPVSPKEVKQ